MVFKIYYHSSVHGFHCYNVLIFKNSLNFSIEFYKENISTSVIKSTQNYVSKVIVLFKLNFFPFIWGLER